MNDEESLETALGPEGGIFCEAMSIDDETLRMHFVKERTKDNTELYRHLCKLLEKAKDRWADPDHEITSPIDPTTFNGDFEFSERQIGPYQVIKKIGEGGTSTVYLAEQQQPIARKVALKIIKPGMESMEVLERFRLERVVLETLQHPNIAKIIDAGVTPMGRRYLAMELIEGEQIYSYCKKEHCSEVDILQLVIQIGDAVQFAHQHGVLHRDLKPTNILVSVVSGVPTPFIVDFGIARLLKSSKTMSIETRLGQILGTLEYMSPEQASLGKEKTDTRSDIYALSAVLYELLFGFGPLSKSLSSSTTFQQALKVIADETPKFPATLGLGGKPSRLNDDLKWILLKGLEKQADRRYASAKDFADDLRRYLRNEPISARPPSRVYRIQKFVRRNWLQTISAAVFLMACLIGVTGLAVGWIQSNRYVREADSRRLEAERLATLASEETVRANQAEIQAVTLRERALQEAKNAMSAKDKSEKLLHYFVDRLATIQASHRGSQPQPNFGHQ